MTPQEFIVKWQRAALSERSAAQQHFLDLCDLLGEPKNFEVLRNVFTDPQALKPRQSTKEITEEIAKQFAKLSEGMRERGIPPGRAAHFLMKLMFCMFAEDVGLLDKSFPKIFIQVL